MASRRTAVPCPLGWGRAEFETGRLLAPETESLWRKPLQLHRAQAGFRKSFGKRGSVLNVPYLLTMQKDSYVAFLQRCSASAAFAQKACRQHSSRHFPIVSHNGFVEMKFIEYNIAKPRF